MCGYDFQTPKLDINELVRAYEIPIKRVELSQLLFSIHTYYALVIKLLAAEITVTYASPFFRSFLDELTGLSSTKLTNRLSALEDGGIFVELGIKNFLEGDFFSWYLDVWGKPIEESVTAIVRKLAEYEPATAALEPDEVRDLLKSLYQNLLPRKIRHDLGEFFTPDWLAELTIDETGYNGDLEKRLLDPACGSGTFPVLAIKRARMFAEDKLIEKSEALDKIIKNIVGFDLNPLAVIASRTNYLIALGDLIRYRKGDLYIPVYLCDSISISGGETLVGRVYEVSTSVGKFRVPASIIKQFLIDEVFTIADECIRNRYKASDFVKRLLTITKLGSNDVQLMEKLYGDLLKLEIKGVNRIWARVIKNSFAPLFVEKFDFIVGNPPWVNWESLPEEYREATKELWSRYGLLEGTKSQALYKRDLAISFVVVAVDRYSTHEAHISMVVPFNLFKTQGGAGFRTFLATKCSVRKIHDLVRLYPFEGAVNRTSVISLSRGKTTFPIPSISWEKDKEADLERISNVDELSKVTTTTKMIIKPIEGSSRPNSSWLIVKAEAGEAIEKIIGPSIYEAQAASNTRGANGIFWIRCS